MQRHATAALVLRAVFVLLVAFGLMLGGVAIDMLAGTSPVATLSFLVIGITFGTIMIYVIITSSFPKTNGKTVDGETAGH